MIGIYDSGIGGLGIFNKVQALLPQESIWYFGDTAHFPFGDKPEAEVREITLAGLQKLATKCSILVIACNTASVNDIEYYRAEIGMPIIAVVPVIKTASQLTHSNEFALLATKATVSADYTQHMITEFAANMNVHGIACSGLANAVETGDMALTEQLVKQFIAEIGNSDVVVLGCTHYTLIKGLIQNVVGPDIKVIDSNEAVARQVLRVMRAEQLEQPSSSPSYIFECSGDNEAFQQQIQKYVQK